jgi:hypothetical protein
MTARAKRIVEVSLLALGVGLGGCGQPPDDAAPLGTLSIALSDASLNYVYDVIVTGPDGFKAEQAIRAAETGPTEQLVAATFFTLPPGYYDVTANVLHGHGAPAAPCASAHGTARVIAGETAGLTLVSSCTSDAAGGLDVTIAPDGAPDWVKVDLAPSVLTPVCQNVTITLTAKDPEDERVTYSLDLTSKVHGSHPALSFADNVGTFTADRNGPYGFTANACDPYACSPFTFSISLTMTPADDADDDGLADACEPPSVTQASD